MAQTYCATDIRERRFEIVMCSRTVAMTLNVRPLLPSITYHDSGDGKSSLQLNRFGKALVTLRVVCH